MRLTKKQKDQIKMEKERLLMEMSAESDQDKWDDLNEKYKAYDEMLKPSWKISPDTILVVAGGLLQVLLILNFEKLDVITSKAINFVIKGRAQ